MLKFYRGKKQDYTSEEIDGSGEKLLSTQDKADLRVPGLHHFSSELGIHQIRVSGKAGNESISPHLSSTAQG